MKSVRGDSPSEREARIRRRFGKTILNSLLHPSAPWTFQERKIVTVT
jgi:hypothetical protein